MAALAVPAFSPCQTDRGQFSDAEKQAFAEASDLMTQCQISRKAGRLGQAERQCAAAIQLYNSVGRPAQGYTATLGMIYYEEGFKRLGFVTLRDSWTGFGFHGTAEAELYLGRIAIEMREYKTALEVVQRFRKEQATQLSIPNSTREFWPVGDDVPALQATIEFLEAERLREAEGANEKTMKLLRDADKLCPQNVAICYALGRQLQRTVVGLAPAPYYRVVSEKGAGGIKWVADDWLRGHADALRKEAENKEAQSKGQ